MTRHIYNIYEAKTHLSSLLQRVNEGEEIVIAKCGKPHWKIVPLEPDKVDAGPKRVPGLGKGKIWAAPDAFSAEFDAEIADMFEQSEIFPDEREEK